MAKAKTRSTRKTTKKKAAAKPRVKPKFSAAELEIIERAASFGIPQDIKAGLLSVSERTLQNRLKKSPDVHALYEKGVKEAHGKVINTAFSMATNGKNTAMTIFWLKARMGWKDKSELTVNVGEMAEEARKALAELLPQGIPQPGVKPKGDA